MKFLKWIASTIEDKQGQISSKRIGFFYCLWMLNRAVEMTKTNEIVIYSIAGLAFALAGLTIPEWFSTIKKTSSTTETKTTDTATT